MKTKEAAFEAAIAAASLALRQGHEVQISAPASETSTAPRTLAEVPSGARYERRYSKRPPFRWQSLPS
jgi:hypothetical protein